MKISFYDTFIVQNFKIAHFPPNNYRNRTKNKGQKYPIFSIYDTFAKGKFKNSDFHPYFYKEIVLKIGGQN